MPNRFLLRNALVRAAKLHNPTSPQSALEHLIVGKFLVEVHDGKTVVRTEEAGGSIFFATADLGPGQVLELAEEALQWLMTQTDPTNPPLNPRRITRLRASFGQVTWRQESAPFP